MSPRGARGAGARRKDAAPPPRVPAPRAALPAMTRPAYALAVAVAAACALAAVTYPLFDPDLWQHLAVGRWLWAHAALPHTHLWSWPTFGAPDAPPSWLFRALLWPVWAQWGLTGAFAWRWLATLAAFALLLAAARRAGATGVAPLLALVWCALLWRQRSQVRPETFAAVLAAATLLALEARRAALAAGRAAHHGWALVPLALLWANAHASYYLLFVIGGAYLADDVVRRRPGALGPRGLLPPLALAAAACFANPYGWRLLAQPFEFAFARRGEPVYRAIAELRPPDFARNVTNGLPLFVLLVPVLAVARARRRGFDAAAALVTTVALAQALASQRFVGYAAVLVAPFFARDLGDLAGRVRWPALLAPPAMRAALAALACLALAAPELRFGPPLGIGMHWERVPVRACDWIDSYGVRGRAFHPFDYGGYLLWRFPEDRGRLPFMDVHQSGSRALRDAYVRAGEDTAGWAALDRQYRFDWVLLPRGPSSKQRILDWLDADPAWALVFADDVAALYVRRDGANARVARDWAYTLMPGGTRALGRLPQRLRDDPGAVGRLADELSRAIGASEHHLMARALLNSLQGAPPPGAPPAAPIPAPGPSPGTPPTSSPFPAR